MKKIISMLVWKMDQFKDIGKEARACIEQFSGGPLHEGDTSDEFKMNYPKEYGILRHFHAITPIGWYAITFLEWLLIWDRNKPVLTIGAA